MGFAMGGYGSMKLAIKYPGLFAGITAYNGPLQFDTTAAMWLPEILLENAGPPYYYQYGAGIFTDLIFTGSGGFSPNLNLFPYQVEFLYDSLGEMVDSVMLKWKEHDCSRLVKTLDTISDDHPSLFFACGINDFLYFHPTNICFADTLDDLGIDYEFLTTNDGHVLSDEMLLAGMYFLDSIMSDSIFVGTAKFEMKESNSFSIYPNPVSNRLYISSYDIILSVDILNISGRVMMNHDCNDIQLQIDIQDLPDGIYFCILKTNEGIQTAKIIKF